MTLSLFSRIIFLFGSALLLVACEGSHQPLSTDLPIYQTAGKLRLAAAIVKHQTLPQELSPLQAPLLLTPAQALQDWANQRLDTAAPEGIALIILKKYDLREIPLTSQSNFLTSWMDTDKERIEGDLEITIEFYDGKGQIVGKESAKVTHGRNFEYDLTPRERQGAWRKEIMILLDLLDLDLTPRLKPYLAKDKKPAEQKKK